jgi:hypothetical protein
MHARRLACFLLGLWLAGGLFMTFVAAQNLRHVDRLLSHSDPTATVAFQQLGPNARALMRYQAAETNRWLLHSWENTQLAGGVAFLVLMLFWSHENHMVLAGILVLLVLTAAQRFLLTPEVTALGQMLDFASPTGNEHERSQLWVAQTAYLSVEVVKWAISILLTARMLFSRKRSGRSRDARHELDRVDKRNYRGVNR